jgi:hypothetical protein
VDPRSRESIALLGALAQVSRALSDIRLDPHSCRGHPGDPHHVVRAQLDPVEGVGHGRPSAGQLAPAPETFGLECAERSDPLGLG